MPIDDIPNDPWRRLVGELQGFQDTERQSWGEIDDLMIARFLAGECDEEERAAVESASRQFPELKECITLAGEALSDVYSAETVSQEERFLDLAATSVASRQGNRVSIGRRVWRSALAGAVPHWAAAACLLIAVGLGCALIMRESSLNARVARLSEELRESREDYGVSVPRATTSAEVRSLQDELQVLKNQFAGLNEQPQVETPTFAEKPQALEDRDTTERLVTSVRGCKHVACLVPYTVCRYVEETVSDAQGGYTAYRPVRETGEREEATILPHDLADEPPTLPTDELLAAIAHKMNLVRWAAADALSRSADSESRAKARAAVIEMLKKRDDQGRAAADYVLNGRIAEGFGTDLSESARVALASPDRIVCWAGLHYFLVVRQCFEDKGQTVSSPTYFPPGFVAKLVDQLVQIIETKDEDPLLYKAAVYLLGQFNGEAKPALDDLVQIVESDGDPQTRRWAAYAIGQIGTEAKSAAPGLGRLLSKEASQPDGKIDETVFPAVAYAYGELQSGDRQSSETKKVAATLINCLGSANPNISYWSAYALWKINGPAPPTSDNSKSGGYSAPSPETYSSPPPYTTPPTYGSSVPSTYGSAPPTTVAKPPRASSGSDRESDSSRNSSPVNSRANTDVTQPVRPVPTPALQQEVDVGGWRSSRD